CVSLQLHSIAQTRLAAKVGSGLSLRSRVIDFRARENSAAVDAAYDQHLAIGQQRRRVLEPTLIEAARQSPILGGWMVDFRARQRVAVAIGASCDQHRALGEEGCSVEVTANIGPASVGPHPGGWVVDFRDSDHVVRPPCATAGDKYFAVR